MAYTEVLTYEVLRSIDSATFTGSYQALGTPLLFPATIVKCINDSNVNVTISIDGVHDHEFITAASGFVYDNTTNRTSSTSGIFAPAGRQYYVKSSMGTGLVYLVVQYIQVVNIGDAR